MRRSSGRPLGQVARDRDRNEGLREPSSGGSQTCRSLDGSARPVCVRTRREACVAGAGKGRGTWRVRSGGGGGQIVQGSGRGAETPEGLGSEGAQCGWSPGPCWVRAGAGVEGTGGSEPVALNAHVSQLEPNGRRWAGPERSRMLPTPSRFLSLRFLSHLFSLFKGEGSGARQGQVLLLLCVFLLSRHRHG